MTIRNGSDDRPTSIVGERLLRHSRREAWSRDLVWFQIEELNGMFDGLQARPGRVSVKRLSAARPRIGRIILAATWNEKMYRDEALAFVRDGLERPADAFGPAVLLLGTKTPPSPEEERWLRTLPSHVVRTVKCVTEG